MAGLVKRKSRTTPLSKRREGNAIHLPSMPAVWEINGRPATEGNDYSSSLPDFGTQREVFYARPGGHHKSYAITAQHVNGVCVPANTAIASRASKPKRHCGWVDYGLFFVTWTHDDFGDR